MPTISNGEEPTPGYSGNVKMYSTQKGWGFIICKDVERDVFLHVRNIIGDTPVHAIDSKKGHNVLAEFALGYDNKNNPQAFNVKLTYKEDTAGDSADAYAATSGSWSKEKAAGGGAGGGHSKPWRSSGGETGGGGEWSGGNEGGSKWSSRDGGGNGSWKQGDSWGGEHSSAYGAEDDYYASGAPRRGGAASSYSGGGGGVVVAGRRGGNSRERSRDYRAGEAPPKVRPRDMDYGDRRTYSSPDPGYRARFVEREAVDRPDRYRREADLVPAVYERGAYRDSERGRPSYDYEDVPSRAPRDGYRGDRGYEQRGYGDRDDRDRRPPVDRGRYEDHGYRDEMLYDRSRRDPGDRYRGDRYDDRPRDRDRYREPDYPLPRPGYGERDRERDHERRRDYPDVRRPPRDDYERGGGGGYKRRADSPPHSQPPLLKSRRAAPPPWSREEEAAARRDRDRSRGGGRASSPRSKPPLARTGRPADGRGGGSGMQDEKLSAEQHQANLPAEDWSGSILEFTILVSRHMARRLEDGQMVDIEKETGAKLTLQKDGYNGSDDRVVDVEASSGEKLRDAITSIVRDAAEENGRLLLLRLLLARPVASSVIGLGGRNVKGINVVTGCRVQVQPTARNEPLQEVCVRGGDVPSLMRVCAIIHGFMQIAEGQGPGSGGGDDADGGRGGSGGGGAGAADGAPPATGGTLEKRSKDQPLPRRTKAAAAAAAAGGPPAASAAESSGGNRTGEEGGVEAEEPCDLDPYMQADSQGAAHSGDEARDGGGVPAGPPTENLPWPWVALEHPDDPQSYYYHNEETGETSWYPPDSSGQAGGGQEPLMLNV